MAARSQILRSWRYAALCLSFTFLALPGLRMQLNGQDLTGVDSRVVLTGDPTLPKGEGTRTFFFRTEVVRPPDASSSGIGNAPKDPLRGPGINTWDVSIFRNFLMGKEGTRGFLLREMYSSRCTAHPTGSKGLFLIIGHI